MTLVAWIHPLYSLSGFLIGLLVGQTGMGGGALMTPILVVLFGMHPTAAVGTDLLFAAATKTAGTLVHGSHHTVDWGVVGRLASGSVPATAVMLLIMSHLDITSAWAAHAASILLDMMLIWTAIVLILRRQLQAALSSRLDRLLPRQVELLTYLTGILLGIFVTVSSVGAGALGVAALVLLYPRLPMAIIIGSDIAHAVPLTLLAGLGHWMIGSIEWPALGSMLLGSIPGVIVGSYPDAGCCSAAGVGGSALFSRGKFGVLNPGNRVAAPAEVLR